MDANVWHQVPRGEAATRELTEGGGATPPANGATGPEEGPGSGKQTGAAHDVADETDEASEPDKEAVPRESSPGGDDRPAQRPDTTAPIG